MDVLGNQSWELVSVDNGIAYFKRPIDEAERAKWSEEMASRKRKKLNDKQ